MPKDTLCGIMLDDNRSDFVYASICLKEYIQEKFSNTQLILHHALSLEDLKKMMSLEQKIRFILIDYSMPGINGDEVILTLKRENKYSGGIIGLSGSNENEFKNKMLEAGADTFIQKESNFNNYKDNLGHAVEEYILKNN